MVVKREHAYFVGLGGWLGVGLQFYDELKVPDGLYYGEVAELLN